MRTPEVEPEASARAAIRVCQSAERGRVVGDGAMYFYIQDVIVLPELQRNGHGRRIMDAVMAYLDANAPPGAFVGLMAADGVAGFYERYGFAERPAGRPGMYRVWE